MLQYDCISARIVRCPDSDVYNGMARSLHIPQVYQNLFDE